MDERKKVFLLFAAGLIFRFLHYLIFADEIIAGPDQIKNIQLARRFAEGDFSGFLDTYWTPLYPLLLGIVSLFSDSLIFPSVLVSIIASSLAVPLVYFFVRQSYGRQEALIASLITVFYPHLLNSFFAIGTENIYLLLITGALIVGWRAIRDDRINDFFFAGMLLGFAYLTRPEAFAYPVLFIVFKPLKNFLDGKSPHKNTSVQIAALLFGFALLATPYLLFLRSATGNWTISGKAEINTVVGEIQEEEEIEEGGQSEKFRYQPAREIVRYFVFNLLIVNKNFPYLVPLFLLILTGIGIFCEPWSRERFCREIYLILFVVATIAGYAAAVIQTRYFYVILPVFFGWTAHGIIVLEKWFRQTLGNLRPHRNFLLVKPQTFVALILTFIYFYTLPINLFIRSSYTPRQITERMEREAGLWLKQNGKIAPLIFSAGMRPVFYAEGKQLPPVTKNTDGIFKQIESNQVDYVIVSNIYLMRNPFLENLPEMLEKRPEFEMIYEKKDQSGNKISIYKLKSAIKNDMAESSDRISKQ